MLLPVFLSLFNTSSIASTGGTPVKARRSKTASLTLPAELAARAAFLAHLHRQSTVEEWLTHIIQERVELEEAAFTGARQEMGSKAG